MTSDPTTISKAVQVSINCLTADLPVTRSRPPDPPGQGPGPHHAGRDLAVPRPGKSTAVYPRSRGA